MNWNQFRTARDLVAAHLSEEAFSGEDLARVLTDHQVAANHQEIDQIGTLLLNCAQIAVADRTQTRFQRSNTKQYRYDGHNHGAGRVQTDPVYDLIIIGAGYAGRAAAFQAVSVGSTARRPDLRTAPRLSARPGAASSPC